MRVFAIGDTHLSFKNGVLYKPMDIFGEQWKNHPEKIKQNWLSAIREEDLVFIVGDISWATKPSEVGEDIAFLSQLPGYKILIRGNHDYWWGSLSKVQSCLTSHNMKALNGDILEFENCVIGGLRLWDIPDLNWRPFYQSKFHRELTEQDAHILEKETHRLQKCLELMQKSSALKILLLHYPPTTPDLVDTEYTKMIEQAGVTHCIFGHLHGLLISDRKQCFGFKNNVSYHLVSADWLDFDPLLICEI